jgi:hypothetical protein
MAALAGGLEQYPLDIGAVASGTGQVGLHGTYAAVVAVDTVTNIVTNAVMNAVTNVVTNVVEINTRWSRHQWQVFM